MFVGILYQDGTQDLYSVDYMYHLVQDHFVEKEIKFTYNKLC